MSGGLAAGPSWALLYDHLTDPAAANPAELLMLWPFTGPQPAATVAASTSAQREPFWFLTCNWDLLASSTLKTTASHVGRRLGNSELYIETYLSCLFAFVYEPPVTAQQETPSEIQGLSGAPDA